VKASEQGRYNMGEKTMIWIAFMSIRLDSTSREGETPVESPWQRN
jgi:hypothetical protein